jgi:hypothetical protein
MRDPAARPLAVPPLQRFELDHADILPTVLSLTAEIQGGFFDKGDVGGFSGPIAVETGGAIMVNLYTNPQEDASIGVRHIPMAVPVIAAAGEYMTSC